MQVNDWFIHNWDIVRKCFNQGSLRSDNEIQPFISADEHNVDLHVQEALLQQQLLGHQLTKFCSLTLSAMVKKGQALMIMETTWWMELFTLVVIF